VSALTVPPDRLRDLEQRLMLYYTGVQRTAHDIIEEQLQRTSQGQIDNELAGLSSLVDRGLEVLYGSGPLSAFGELLHDGWQLKRRCSAQTTNSNLDQLYSQARAAGAVGGKLLGAGGGGFFLFYVEPDKQASIRSALAKLREVRFQFETSGSTIIVYRP
jgi:D-glycero-alpha-D-manno-heptose-7-phosphate kinase